MATGIRPRVLRAGLTCLAALVVGTSGLAANTPVPAGRPSADDVLSWLKAGNSRYVAGTREHPAEDAARRQQGATQGQQPRVTILGCSDSRVPPEHLFDAGLGELFVVRVAGNVADTDEIGTVEYGAEHLGTPLILVLGHSSCGAVTAVVKGDRVEGSIPLLVDNIGPALAVVRAAGAADASAETIDKVIRENVRQSVRDLYARSAIVRELAEAGTVKVAGAVYHLDSGVVEFIDVPALSSVKVAAAESPTPATGPAAAEAESARGGVVPAALAAAASLLLALVAHLVLFAGSTRVKRLKFKSRMMTGMAVYLALAVGPAAALVASAGSTAIHPAAAAIAIGGALAVFAVMIVSLNTLGNHLATIYRMMKQTISHYQGTEP